MYPIALKSQSFVETHICRSSNIMCSQYVYNVSIVESKKIEIKLFIHECPNTISKKSLPERPISCIKF